MHEQGSVCCTDSLAELTMVEQRRDELPQAEEITLEA